MGVPALFRWLTKKYPKIISPVVEEQPYEIDGVQYPVDTTKPNPNGEEMHNLYLDFNGIVHPCSHPENKPPPANESEMMMEIFKYTDRVVNMVRPRRLLMIAIDGVAPRAKMNQQRARRFRAARDAKEADEKKAEFQTLLRQQQQDRDDVSDEEEVIKKTWDSNVITPGTPFMFILAQSIRYWVQWKLNTDPAWAELKVIISDASVPGEGEHKIMQFIRSQRSDPEYDPNTRHVMYGLDADLIMLGIATHEPHFRVLREDVFTRDAKAKTCKLCGQQGHYAENCRGNAKVKAGEFDEKGTTEELKPFIWLHVPVLREYLAAEMFVPGQPFRFDLERALDDWVFMCFFVGNDFLPHLPSLDIHEDGIDKLIAIWRDNLPLMGGYVTCDGNVNLARAQIILQGLAKQEDAIFKRRKEVADRRERNERRREQQQEAREAQRNPKRRRNSPDYNRGGRVDTRAPTGPVETFEATNYPTLDYNSIVNRGAVDKASTTNKSAAAVLKEQMLAQRAAATETPTKTAATNGTANGADGSPNTDSNTPGSALGKRKAALMEEQDAASDSGTPGRNTPLTKTDTNEEPPPVDPDLDTVRLWEPGYADRYYEQKFHVSPNDIEFRHKVARAYVEGLCWVLLYYFQGCPSWTWYYPYHYAPFAADFVDIDKMEVKFDKGTPFRPYEQLMGVLPASSNHAIPPAFHPLMTDEDSEIVDFYPEDFDLDLNGKKQSWKAVVLLPFIDEKRLLKAMGTKYPLLSDDERARNEFGKDALIISDQNPLYDELALQFYSKKAKDGKETVKLSMRKGRLAGTVSKNHDFLPHMDLVGPEADIKLEPVVDDDRSLNVHFTMPPPTHVHKSMLFPGVVLPAPVLDKSDLAILRSKARNSGRDFGGAPLYDNTRRDPMDQQNRGGRINYAADRPPLNANGGYNNGGQNSRDNPFAAFLDPRFASNMPPAGRGGPPPPPPQSQRYGAANGYDQNQGQYGGYGGGGQGGYYNDYQGQGQGQGYYGNQGGQNQYYGGRNGDYQQQYAQGGQGAGNGYYQYPGQGQNQGQGYPPRDDRRGGRGGGNNYGGGYNQGGGGGYGRR
ncbi:5'-3' exoribonuclease 2 [Exophiala dermatitidis]|uniref:5'-3' exoribonuclease n=1 Tax=Exophiala dermatitidis TaxID=5970 RepID=A0AAN6IWT6_EXODE|nr:5'-3' exoribonuclease 2 [Exophiala dermatitidis]KAJ4522311.1 5'-3' exoribonuclease 2 [Exophiala dermatitidis]KAJ4529636.1 5'-3' exoribonuclease 2 [Exophiala dermatitidis]KAJ4543200.1 5'-3' exoribonuclease 2 [Exophiala dermatitidis]KAJ4543699.1 5'-3' exoribonuclease 2 [Exophiala dermatitidis]